MARPLRVLVAELACDLSATACAGRRGGRGRRASRRPSGGRRRPAPRCRGAAGLVGQAVVQADVGRCLPSPHVSKQAARRCRAARPAQLVAVTVARPRRAAIAFADPGARLQSSAHTTTGRYWRAGRKGLGTIVAVGGKPEASRTLAARPGHAGRGARMSPIDALRSGRAGLPPVVPSCRTPTRLDA